MLIEKYKDMLKNLISSKIIGQKQLKVYIKKDMIVFD